MITNNDGLWRYTLNDIVEIAGFSPEDGQPLIRFVERKGYFFFYNAINPVCAKNSYSVLDSASGVNSLPNRFLRTL